LRERRHHIDDLPQSLSPSQQLLLLGLSADIEVSVNDAVLGRRAYARGVLTMLHEGGHCGGQSSRLENIRSKKIRQIWQQ
jgi:hypothetical protein